MSSQASLEGRILAHRKLLARIVAAMGDAKLDGFLHDRDHVGAHEEDPGSDPDPAFALEAALADELGKIGAEVSRLREG